jgi:EAL domain-containing protein (putative c-di-GMP-specific phosphodiesterase class I)
VAEGIETEKQIEVLRRLGCQLGQGFLLSRPMDAAETERFLRLQAKNKTQSPQP